MDATRGGRAHGYEAGADMTKSEPAQRFFRISGVFALAAFSLLISSPVLAQIDKRSADSLVLLGNSSLSKGKLEDAKGLFESALEIDEESIPAQMGLGRIALAERNWAKAKGIFDDVIDADSGNVAARYCAAIAHREYGTEVAIFLRAHHWSKSERLFEWVLAHDSLFSDALYQYSLLQRYRENWDRMFRLAHRQVAKRPELTNAQLGLYKTYRYFVAVADPDTVATPWLRQNPSAYADYFAAELLRRGKRLAQAETLFTAMLHARTDVPAQAIYLSLAKIAFARGDAALGTRYYWLAVDNIRTWLGGDVVFEDLKYIVSDEEEAVYSRLSSDKKKVAFFHAFWGRRNPTPGGIVNARLAEHYRRLLVAEQDYEYYGFRSWYNNPDKLQWLTFPKSFLLNEEFNDKGVIYLRHGDPDYVRRSMTEEESWIYNQTDQAPQRIFHFTITNSSSSNWRLTSLPQSPGLIADLAMFDSRYRNIMMAQSGEQMKYQDAISEDSKVLVEAALSSDNHTWSKETKTFTVPFSVDIFRHDSGRTQVDIPYAIPFDAFKEDVPKGDRVAIEVGLAVSKASGDTAISRLDTLRIPSSQVARGGSFIGHYRFRLVPDSLRFAMAIQPVGTNCVGTWSRTLRIPSFASKDMQLSSVEFLLPSDQELSIEIDGIKVIQSPFEIVANDRPLYTYVQIYNLIKDISGNTEYTAAYRINPGTSPSRGNARLLLEKTVEGTEEMATEFRSLDLTDIDEGTYTLTISITDRKRVHTLSRSRTIEIVHP